jgi:hypothetical protein
VVQFGFERIDACGRQGGLRVGATSHKFHAALQHPFFCFEVFFEAGVQPGH